MEEQSLWGSQLLLCELDNLSDSLPLCVGVSAASSRPGGGVCPWAPCAALEDLVP